MFFFPTGFGLMLPDGVSRFDSQTVNPIPTVFDVPTQSVDTPPVIPPFEFPPVGPPPEQTGGFETVQPVKMPPLVPPVETPPIIVFPTAGGDTVKTSPVVANTPPIFAEAAPLRNAASGRLEIDLTAKSETPAAEDDLIFGIPKTYVLIGAAGAALLWFMSSKK